MTKAITLLRAALSPIFQTANVEKPDQVTRAELESLFADLLSR